MLRHLIAAVLISVLSLAGASAARADRVLVFAASSLKNALEQMAEEFEAESGHRVALSFAGSSLLARQIALGAPADVFLSANVGWMDKLAREGRLQPGTRRDLLGNTLVVVARRRDLPEPPPAPRPLQPGAPLLLDRLADGGVLAMALVDAVPAGLYGKAALQSLGAWQALRPRVAEADNARAALALVSSGAARLGIVYGSDARADPSVAVVATFPPESHPPIVYPVAALAGHDRVAVRAFLDYLAGDAAAAVFAAEGFRVLGAGR